ncbi:HIRA-interacting protein 3 isoform 2-T2 [Hipposideros larvatus]
MCLAFGSYKLFPRGFLLFRRVCPFSPVFRQHRGVSVAGLLCYTQKLPAPSRFQTRTLKTIRSKKRKEPRDLLPTTAGESKLDPQPTPNGPSPDRAATPRVRKLLSNGLTGGPEKKKAGTTDPWRCKMAREKMQEFTRSLFRGRPDLSTLTHSIVRQRFLAHAGRDHLEPEEKQALKRLVEDELLKMQVDEEGAREEGLHRAKKAKRPPTTPCRDPRRKRPRSNSESELSSAASSPDCSSPPAEKGMAAAGSLKESPKRASKKVVESIDEEGQQRDLTAKTGLEEAMAKNGEEKEEGSARASKVWKEESSEEEEEGKGSKGSIRRKPVTKNKQAPGRTSPSRVQSMEAGGSDRCGEDHPAVRRLKRYIRACGAHRNYKKLLGPCRSRKECLSILRAELEALGMKGNPSLEKCRTLKLQREEAAEVASLDMSNIISGSGRPRRCTAWNPSEAAAPGELYRRTLDSEEEWPRRLPPDWSHMRGIISSDGESN